MTPTATLIAKEQVLSAPSHIPYLGPYILFLQRYHLHDLSRQYMALLDQMPLPLLQHWKKYGEEEQLQLILFAFENYLQQITTGKLLEGLAAIVTQWQANTLIISNKELQLHDIAHLYSLGKQALLKLIPYYTASPELITAISLELEQCYAVLQQQMLVQITEVHQEHLPGNRHAQHNQAEEELKRSQALLLEAQQVAHLGSWEWDLVTGQFSWSDETYRIFGLEPGEMPVNLDIFLNYIHPEDRQKYQLALDHTMQFGVPYQLQHRIIGQDKAIRWLLSTGMPVQDPSGTVCRITGTGLDITDQKLVEEALQLSETKFRTLFDQSGDAILLMTSKGFIDCNLAAVAMLGASSQEEILMLHPIEISPPYQPDKIHSYTKLQTMVNKAMQEGGCRFEWLCKKLNHQEFWTEVLFTPIPLEGKTVIYAVFRDITMRKAAEKELENKNKALKEAYKELKAAQKELQQINNVLEERVEQRTQEILQKNHELSITNKELNRINIDLDNFIYTASHDLKAPVSNLEGLSSQLRKKLSDRLNPTEAMMMDMVITSVNKLKATIADLTEITKVQKELDEEKESVAFAELLEDIKSDIHEMIEGTHAVINAHFEVPEILYARKNLRSILYNLLSNAIKYRSSERSPEINIHTWSETDKVVLSVKDNGLGIQEAQSHKLFKMFKRIYSHVEGSGIGLYIVKRIIENNGGEIQVHSQPGQGSTFIVHFKINTAAPVSLEEVNPE